MKPHKHAEIIKAWADGKAIQSRDPAYGGMEWLECESPSWSLIAEYRIKPELKYPETKMSKQDLKRAFHAANGETEKGWRGIANAAIARAIKDGQVVIKEQEK